MIDGFGLVADDVINIRFYWCLRTQWLVYYYGI